jgi:hypothetical protein
MSRGQKCSYGYERTQGNWRLFIAIPIRMVAIQSWPRLFCTGLWYPEFTVLHCRFDSKGPNNQVIPSPLAKWVSRDEVKPIPEP